MSDLKNIKNFCDEYLNIRNIKDYDRAHNGLQFENNGTVTKTGAAVDANLLTIEYSIKEKIDLLIVHHGLFWSEAAPVTENLYKKYKLLIDNNIAVYSAHLPLDMHEEIGNNTSIIHSLELKKIEKLLVDKNLNFEVPICVIESNRDELKEKITKLFPGTKCMEFGPIIPKKIAVCSGSGGSLVSETIKYNVDTIITGEVQQHIFTTAYENKLNIYACGHYATEVFGVQKLSDLIAKKFDIPWIFLPENCEI